MDIFDQEMDIFEQQEMSKSRPQVKNKLSDWYDWLINHVPKPIKDGASKAFKTFKDKIVGLYNMVTGSGNQVPKGSHMAETLEAQLKGSRSRKTEPIKFEQAFNGAYRSYRINGRPRMDVETFFHQIRGDLIGLIKRELNDLSLARVETTMWIRFIREDEEGQERVELAFNSLMTSVYRGSDLDQIVDGMITDMKFQIENPALLNSRFVFDEVLFTNVDFHQLNLTRGSSYLPLPDWLAKKKAIMNPKNEDKECFKWAVIAASRWEEINNNPQRISKLKRFEKDFDWSGIGFPVSVKDISKFEFRNQISINLLAIEGKQIYICKKGGNHKRIINLMIISENNRKHYVTNLLAGYYPVKILSIREKNAFV